MPASAGEYSFSSVFSNRKLSSYVSHTVPTHVITLTQVGTSVYLGQTHLGTTFKFLLGSESFHLGQLGMMSLVSKVTSPNEEHCRKERQCRPVEVDKIMFQPGCPSKINK